VELSRVESEPYHMANCDLREIAEEAMAAVRTQAAAKSIGMVFAGSEPAPVRGDRRLLERAIVNLANNAVKYSPGGSPVTVSVGVDGTQVRCLVRDQGYGISEKNQQRLFERFARFATADQPREKGIGLGLAFVKTVIERHEGEVTVTSAVGVGSTFGFVLPRAAAEVDEDESLVDDGPVDEAHDTTRHDR
jgi:signal transduction histidine kinase